MKFQIGLTNQTKVSFVGGGYDQQLQRLGNASEKSKTDHIVSGTYTCMLFQLTLIVEQQSCLTMKVAIAM